jgi:hypothetical protein
LHQFIDRPSSTGKRRFIEGFKSAKKTDEGTAMSPELHDRKPRGDSVDEILFLSLLCDSSVNRG